MNQKLDYKSFGSFVFWIPNHTAAHRGIYNNNFQQYAHNEQQIQFNSKEKEKSIAKKKTFQITTKYKILAHDYCSTNKKIFTYFVFFFQKKVTEVIIGICFLYIPIYISKYNLHFIYILKYNLHF